MVDGAVLEGLLVVAGLMIVGCLAGVDLATGRVPNRVVLTSVAAVIVLAAAGSLVAGHAQLLVGVLVGAAIVGVPWLVVALVSDGGGVGGGDVKLAVLVGCLVGMVDPISAEVTLAVSLALWLLLGVRSRFREQATSFVFGPALAIAGFAGLLVATVLARDGVGLQIESLVGGGRPGWR